MENKEFKQFKINTPTKSNIAMLLFMVIGLVSSFFVSFIVTIFMKGQSIMAAMIINQLFSSLVPILLYMIVTVQRPKDFLPLVRLQFTDAVLIVGIIFCLQPVMMLLSAISTLWANNDVADLVSTLGDTPKDLILSFIGIAILPGILEELMFRGVLLSGYKKMPLLKAAFVNGLFFAIMHMNLQQFLYAFVLGFIFVLLVHYTKTIYASILAHFTINATQLLISNLFTKLQKSASESTSFSPMDIPAEVTNTLEIKLQGVAAAGVLTVLILPLLVGVCFLFMRRHRKAKTKLSDEYYLEDISTDQEITRPRGIIFNLSFLAVIAYYAFNMLVINV